MSAHRLSQVHPSPVVYQVCVTQMVQRSGPQKYHGMHALLIICCAKCRRLAPYVKGRTTPDQQLRSCSLQ